MKIGSIQTFFASEIVNILASTDNIPTSVNFISHREWRNAKEDVMIELCNKISRKSFNTAVNEIYKMELKF